MHSTKLKFLLVDDNPMIFLDIKFFLEQKGFEVLTVPEKSIINNFEDAQKACDLEIPHLAILDVDLGKEQKHDGLDIALYIREHFYSPVIIFSGHDDTEYIRRASEIGLVNYIVKLEKPLNLTQLLTTIRLLLPQAEEAAKRRTSSMFIEVKKYTTHKNDDAVYMKRRIEFAGLYRISTEGAPKNCVLFEMRNSEKYIYRSSLSEAHLLLPEHFIRFSDHQILNVFLFDGKSKSNPWVYFIGEKVYEVSKTYQNTKTLSLLNRYCMQL